MSTAVSIAGIFDTSSFSWGEDIFNFAVTRIKNQNAAYQNLNSTVVDAACDETTAVRAYWKLRTENFDVPVHGIVGARCSGASVSLARIAGLEKVNMVSPSATSSILSDAEEFPYFTRLVAPDDSRGEVGAVVETLKWFGWKRVSILSTDTIYAKDYVSEFRRLWEGNDISGEVTYSNVIRLGADGTLDIDSLDTALRGVPTDDPANNSRIILLVAQNQHAYPLLKRAEETGFQPDTVWVGTSSWAGPRDVKLDSFVKRDQPGYIGVGPIQHPNAEGYLNEFNNWARFNGAGSLEQMPSFAAEMIDAVTSLVRAIYQVPLSDRRNGDEIRQRLLATDMEGASGRVQFTKVGDRKDPLYSILHLRRNERGNLEWLNVGESGTVEGAATADLSRMCWATLGCSLTTVPSDSYPVPPPKLPVWIIAVLVVVIILLIAVAVKYWRSRRSKRMIKQELETFRDSVVGMRTANAVYLPSIGDRPKEGIKRDTKSITVQWCWKETSFAMDRHHPDQVVGDVKDCWIKYSDEANAVLEAAFQQQGWKGSVSPLSGYLVDFSSMTQTKQQTGFTREVQRLVDTSNSSTGGSNDPLAFLPASELYDIATDNVKFGEELPDDIKNEPQMVLVPGDVIQISKQKKDTDWAFGTKLYHHDENVARSIVSGMTSDTATVSSDEDDANIFADTGWFQMVATRVPTTEDLQALKRNVGDTDALNAPSHWNDVADPSVVQVQELKKEDSEYQKIERAFKSSLGRSAKISSIQRIENLAMWQSFVVKRQTILSRELGDDPAADTSLQRKRLERCWLWHGTNVEVMGKILQQGFNRSFCGKNATVYGKGVYFAPDTSYSASPTYAVKDPKGYQYVMACRVAVGEYCPGVSNALTPDLRDAKTHTLYDSTIGLLSGDSMANPSIYVTYHDSQAYPEYLIKFKT
ncbi:unnamed protein product [Cylindrotheca closterium]|uniref:Poly [ADP-ribose] polymerase n=1 Tax=Cylindrotheca closterium TaxID=2856 RepID=A0AAD2FZG6_9STRA|nr:unnamed protein product [Cylindrotheca closterium]